MPADCRKGNAFKSEQETMAYDTSFVKSKLPFANSIATFRRRTSKPAMVVLYENVPKEFSDDAHTTVVRKIATST